MKTFAFFKKNRFIFFLSFLMGFSSVFAQDKMFIHTATFDNIRSDGTFSWTLISHPSATNKDNLIVSYLRETSTIGSDGDRVTDPVNVRYVGGPVRIMLPFGKMFNGMKFIVYVPSSHYKRFDSNYFPVEGGLLTLDHPDLNGKPNLQPIFTPAFQLSIPRAFGIYYNNNVWKIFTQNNAGMGSNQHFNVVYGGDDVEIMRHTATAASILPAKNSYSYIYHPKLDNNPNALFVFSPAIKYNHIQTEKQFKVQYEAGKWYMTTADMSPMPVNLEFNIYMYKKSLLATQEVSNQNGVQTYPNPVKDVVHFASAQTISKIEIYDLSGKLLQRSNHHEKSVSVNVSAFSAGNYMVKVTIKDGINSIKLIKK
ncbi:MAG: T9SS type A sorting domain-containing protein [Chryseobacterium sp.]|mgnify:FL=1|nr:T9SS type A sorting domain-containing protein [Chryseobacterium sp.]